MNPPAETLIAPETAPEAETAAAPTDAPVVEDELLVEEISIDGMCGVY